MKAYYILEVDDIMQDGDEAYDSTMHEWIPLLHSDGYPVRNRWAQVRRRIKEPRNQSRIQRNIILHRKITI